MKYFLILAILVMSISASSTVPRFDSFRTDELFHRPLAKPHLSTEFQRMFSTKISEESLHDVNFAGDYRIAEWGCGSSCVAIAVINLKTGAVYDGPFKTLGYGVRRTYEGGEFELDYRPNSRLVIARGCPENRNCGTYYFEWRHNRFLRIRFVPASPIIR